MKRNTSSHDREYKVFCDTKKQPTKSRDAAELPRLADLHGVCGAACIVWCGYTAFKIFVQEKTKSVN